MEGSSPHNDIIDIDETAAADEVLLHLIRSIALFLSVVLAQTAQAATTAAELAQVFLAGTAPTSDVLSAPLTADAVLCRVHATLFAWARREVHANCDVDGFLQEQRVLAIMKTLFRHQRTQPAVQCRILVALLTSYLTRLKAPLVQCEPAGMLASTLDYLLVTKQTTSDSGEPVPEPVLYPLVNAVDSITIEQRECLDALVKLLRWFSAHDPFHKVLAAFIATHHAKLIGVHDTAATRESSDRNVDNALGICFVQTLLQYPDHIFRRDFQCEPFVSTLSHSDTEDDDDSSEDAASSHMNDVSDHLFAAGVGKTCTESSVDMDSNAGDEPAVISTNLSKLKHEKVLVLRHTRRARKTETAMLKKAAAPSLCKHTKHTKAMAPETPRSTKSVDTIEDKREFSIRRKKADGISLLDVHPVFVGIAAVAGTLAALLCAFCHL